MKHLTLCTGRGKTWHVNSTSVSRRSSRIFEEASWGNFSILKEKKDEMRLLLEGETVAARFRTQEEPTFKLEAGFIAEQLQSQKKLYTESYDEIDKRKNK